MNSVADRRHWQGLTLLSLLLLTLKTGGVALASDEAPHEQYRVLEWQELIPEGWEPPLVGTAFNI